MRNLYEIQVKAQCPVNKDDIDLYFFTLESENLVEVEKIIAFFKKRAGTKHLFQEELTRQCATALGVKVTSIGYHSGVKVVCTAP